MLVWDVLSALGCLAERGSGRGAGPGGGNRSVVCLHVGGNVLRAFRGEAFQRGHCARTFRCRTGCGLIGRESRIRNGISLERPYDESIAVLEPIYTRTAHPWAVLGIVPRILRSGASRRAEIYETVRGGRGASTCRRHSCLLRGALGDVDAAIRYCDAAIEERDLQFAAWHAWWPEFEPVRSDPRFADIRRRFNAPRRA